jgi:hypothetical protein
MVLEKGFYKLKDLNSTKIRGTLYGNRLKWFLIQDLKEIRLEDRLNKSNRNMEEVFVEEEAPKREAVA